MGEVAVLRTKEGVFGDYTVAMTYTCCSTCGCVISAEGNQQGAAVLQGDELPMKIPSVTYTSGDGPFGTKLMDNGPQGLSWGQDAALYLGNVGENGDYSAVNLESGLVTLLLKLPARVNVSVPFDAERMMVVLEGGAVYRVPVLGKAYEPKLLTQLPAGATSIARDPWSGRFYVALSTREIVSFSPDDLTLQPFGMTELLGRIAISPDGFLYHVPMYGNVVVIERFPLPATL
jgi:hypothetical protein